ncbi:MAG: hypothetical protein IJN84_08260, partial [Clostridia bacterium]|nr:hypothetical protein [Clostridia bacterium]
QTVSSVSRRARTQKTNNSSNFQGSQYGCLLFFGVEKVFSTLQTRQASFEFASVCAHATHTLDLEQLLIKSVVVQGQVCA